MLMNGGECKLICGEKQVSLKNKGDDALFDYSLEHGSANNSKLDRVNFIVDFDPFSDISCK